jgi:hypothetical protein
MQGFSMGFEHKRRISYEEQMQKWVGMELLNMIL